MTIVRTQGELDAAIGLGDENIIIDPLAGVWLYVSDSATVWASDSATVWASDSATVRASGSATVRASDSATVEASDSATVWASDSATVRASSLVAVHLHSAYVTVEGGVLIDLTSIDEHDPTVWCEVHGVQVADGNAVLYKAVDADLTAGHGYRPTRYAPGETVEAVDWQDDNKCGGGLHLSPTAWQATAYRADAVRWVECRVPVGEVRPIPSLDSGVVAKCKVRSVMVVAEVDRSGRRLAVAS